MKLIIDIDEEVYKGFIDGWIGSSDILRAVRKGTPVIEWLEEMAEKIKREKVGTLKTCETCFWEKEDKYKYPCCECVRNPKPGYDQWQPNYGAKIM